jgi:alpha-1,2-mannosyltransferase
MAVLATRVRIPAVLGGLAAVFLLVALVCWVTGTPLGTDSAVYRAGALAVARGTPLYGPLPDDPSHLPFTYPPVAAVLFLPLVAASRQVAWGLLAVLSVLAVGLLVHTTLRQAAPRWLPWAGPLTAAALALEPVWRTIAFGQVNLVLAALVVADVCLLRGSRGGGVLVGLAAAVKLTPLVFVLHLALVGRRADALRAAGTFVAANVVTALVLPAATARYWGSALLAGDDATTNAYVGNQSLNGIVHRFLGPAPWVFGVVVVLALAGGIGAAVVVRRLARAGRPFPALVVTALYGTAVSPIAWTHHWVWVLPALLVVAHESRRRLAVAGLVAVFAACPVSWLPGPLAAVAYPAGALGLILLLAGARTRAAGRTPPRPGAPEPVGSAA